MSTEIETKSPLGGEVELPLIDTTNEELMKELQANEELIREVNEKEDIKSLPKVSDVEIVNPLTGNKAIVTIDREGTTESKVIQALMSQDSTQEQKDSAISMYLFERGKESASFLMDLYQAKGQNTKETRKFKSQVRFDLTMMANSIAVFFSDTQKQIEEDLESHDLDFALSRFAKRCGSIADKLIEQVNGTAEERMRENGYGIYIDKDGVPYSIYDKEFDEVINRDKKQNNEDGFRATNDGSNVRKDSTEHEGN